MGNHESNCSGRISFAERELGAFLRAVTELYGPEEGRISAEDWLDELESMDGVPGPTTREWRLVTIAAAARLASRLTQKGAQWTDQINRSLSF
jgi:hypothetical protein